MQTDQPDRVVEHAGGGIDTVWVTFTSSSAFHHTFDYTLTENAVPQRAIPPGDIDRLGPADFTSTYAVNFQGNTLANEIWGNDGQNILDGAAGADILRGGGGDDIYFVDNLGDQTVEQAGGGFDLIELFFFAPTSYTLPDNVERIGPYRLGNAPGNTTFIGNALDNEIWGSSGNNILDGGPGADIMKGHGGDDVYIVDNVGDVVIEYSPSDAWGGGNDLIWTSLDYTLPLYVERMGVNGFATTYAINLTGNSLGNELWGNDGVNVIDGRGGADFLHGHGGADTFAFTTALGGGNIDTILDFQPGVDVIALDDAIFTGLAPGALPAGAFNTGTTAQDADDRILYDAATGALYFDADGIASAVQFATVQVGLTLSASDFVVI